VILSGAENQKFEKKPSDAPSVSTQGLGAISRKAFTKVAKKFEI